MSVTMLMLCPLQVDLAALCKRIAWSNYVEVADGAALWAYRSKQKHAWGTPDWAKHTAIAQDNIASAIADQTNSSTHLACTQAFQQAFDKDTSMRLRRFQTLQHHILETLLPAVVNEGLAAAAPSLERMKQRAFDDMYSDDTKMTFIKLSKGIQGCLTDQIHRRLCKPLQLPSHYVLEEAPEVHARRTELHQQLDRLEIAQQKINNIHEAVCTETALQKDLLSLAASSETASDSSQTASPLVGPVASTATLLDGATRPNRALTKEPYTSTDDLQQSADGETEDWSSVSSSSLPEFDQSEVTPDAEASNASSTQTTQQEKSVPLLVNNICEAQSQVSKV